MKNLRRPAPPLRLSGRFFAADGERWHLIKGGGFPAVNDENRQRALAGLSGGEMGQIGRTLDRLIDEVGASVGESGGLARIFHRVVRGFQFQRARSGCAGIAITAEAVPGRGASLYWGVDVFPLDRPRNGSFERIPDESTGIDPDAWELLRLGRAFAAYADALCYVNELDLLLACHTERRSGRRS